MSKDLVLQGAHVSHGMIRINLDGVSHEDSLRTAGENGNCINWILGHIVTYRGRVVEKLGGSQFLSSDEVDLYSRGSAGISAMTNGVADLSKLSSLLEESMKSLRDLIREMTAEQLAESVGAESFPVPVKDTSLGAWLNFMQLHEAYHAGQIGIVRRALGKKGKIG